MKPKKRYVVSYTLEDGRWTAALEGVPGCLTQGRTIEQTRERMREAIQAWFDLEAPYDGTLVDDVRLPAPARALVAEALEAKATVENASKMLSDRSSRAVAALTGAGMSLRDAGTLLGLSRQRAHQLATGTRGGKRRAAGDR